MIANYTEHGFSVYAECLPDTCTACPFWGYSANTDTGICMITGTEIEANGPQDEQRMNDCPVAIHAPANIVVEVSGGMVQNVWADKTVNVDVADFDADDPDDAEAAQNILDVARDQGYVRVW